MPSLIKFIVFCTIIVGLGFGAMFALVNYVEPNPREVEVRIPNDALKLN